MSPPLAPNDVFAGKYRVDRVVGQGGMGVVYAATHLHLGEQVAIKVLQADAHPDEATVARFLREAKSALRIRSEHVARVLDADALPDGSPYMVLELLVGRDLGDALDASGPLRPEVAVDYVLQACEALAEAHRLGIVHRDLKPSNLFLTTTVTGAPLVKVLDFGIAKAPTDGADAAITATSTALGSPAYMSPEQVRSAKHVDARTDVWSLGVVLYELLSNRQPFAADTVPGVIARVIGDVPDPLGMLCDAPKGLVDVVETCMQRRPDDRYQDVAELAVALAPFGPDRAKDRAARICETLGSSGERKPRPPSFHEVRASAAAVTQPLRPEESARTVAIGDAAAETLVAAAALTAPARAEPEPPRASRAPWVVGGALVVLAAGAAAFALRGSPAPDETVAKAPAPSASSATATTTAPAPPRPEPSTASTPTVAPELPTVESSKKPAFKAKPEKPEKPKGPDAPKGHDPTKAQRNDW